MPDRLPLKDDSPRPIPTMVAATNHWRGSRSSKPGVGRARASSISAVSELSSLFARKSKPKFKPKLESMTAVVAGKLLFHFLPFLLSLFGKGGMAKMLCLVTSILAVLRSVSDYSAVLPWVTGMLISGVSVWERIRSRRHAGKPHHP